jgi:hypothetical protein
VSYVLGIGDSCALTRSSRNSRRGDLLVSCLLREDGRDGVLGGVSDNCCVQDTAYLHRSVVRVGVGYLVVRLTSSIAPTLPHASATSLIRLSVMLKGLAGRRSSSPCPIGRHMVSVSIAAGPTRRDPPPIGEPPVSPEMGIRVHRKTRTLHKLDLALRSSHEATQAAVVSCTTEDGGSIPLNSNALRRPSRLLDQASARHLDAIARCP